MYALIMAGGAGTRLWPASRQKNPKQLLGFLGKQTLLQTTYQRLIKGFTPSEIFIATTNAYAGQIKKQLPKVPQINYSLEPVLRDRGPALGLAALIMHHQNPASTFVTAWSDHFIKDEAGYLQTLQQAERLLKAHPELFITIGVAPTFPHTGFGYIEQGKPFKNNGDVGAFHVKSFREKPDQKLAQKFFRDKKYWWNTGYFICGTNHLLHLYKQHLPEIYSVLMQIKPFIGTKQQQSAIDRLYPLMPKVDIEKGLIEKLDQVAMIPAGFDWADVGSWKVIKDVLSEDGHNLIQGKVAVHDTKNSLIYNYENKLVSVVGGEDLVVINTKDALLIVPRHRSEEIKELVKKIAEDEKLKKYL